MNQVSVKDGQEQVVRLQAGAMAVPAGPSVRNRKLQLAVMAFFFAQGLCFASWASRIPDIKSMLQLSEGGLGSILMALPAGQLTAMPVSGRLVTRFGSKKMVLLAILLYSAALINIGMASQVWQLVLALYLFGICGNLANISVNTQGVLAETQLKRPVMGSFHGSWSLAGFTGAFLGTLLVAQHLTPVAHFGIIVGLVGLLVFFAHRHLIPGTEAAGKGARRPLFSLPDKRLLQLGVIGFCCMATEGAMFDWSGVYFQKVVQAPAALVTLGYTAFMCTMATGRFLGDRLVRRFGQKQLVRASGVLIAAGLGLSVALPSLVPVTVGFLMVGFGVSTVIPTVYSAAGKATFIAPGLALATISSISFLGFLIGPPLIGYIAELASLRYSFAVIALLGFGTSLLASRARLIK
ncbi:MFS transporter [Paraflavisolibacter sp. H34]|uniref:MFS transporter n=1 Tax=Huijunlia imazamoxiresistens TaxID=3127457 RepID=UPI003019FF4A